MGMNGTCGLNEWKNSFVILRHCWIDKSRYKFWFSEVGDGGLAETDALRVCLTRFTLEKEHINISAQHNDFKC